MKNVTLAIDEETLVAGRDYARAHHTTLNDMIRQILKRTVVREARAIWTEDLNDGQVVRGVRIRNPFK